MAGVLTRDPVLSHSMTIHTLQGSVLDDLDQGKNAILKPGNEHDDFSWGADVSLFVVSHL